MGTWGCPPAPPPSRGLSPPRRVEGRQETRVSRIFLLPFTLAFLLGLVLCLGFVVLKQTFTRLNSLADGLLELLPLLVLAKKLFAHEEHSYTEAVAGDVLVMPVAGAYLLTILDRIARERHSGAVPVAVLYLVLGQPILDNLDYFRVREKLVRPSLHIFLRKAPRPLKRFFFAKLFLHVCPHESVEGSCTRLILAWASQDIL